MKNQYLEAFLPALLASFVTFGTAVANTPSAQLPQNTVIPKGLSSSDWCGIRSAYEAGRHAVVRQKDGTVFARNPGQEWNAVFNGKGFTITPDHGEWTWGLELVDYGDGAHISLGTIHKDKFSSCPVIDGSRISVVRNECLTEWFINDSRGLEQGWTFQSRPERLEDDQNLKLRFAVRGNLIPKISDDGERADFLSESGNTATTYGKLKAWDADGKSLAVHFEVSDGSGIVISVKDKDARYPVTIDPIAQQAYLKASNSASNTRFGSAIAISGDTVVVGAYFEDSNATGVNGDQSNTSTPSAGAAYVFVRAGGIWTQQAYLKASNTGSDDYFGSAVAISGNTVVVGAGTESSDATGINGDQSNNNASSSGAVYVFVRNGVTWSQQAYVKASNTDAGDRFGISIGISDDTLVVGALRDDSNATGVNGNDSDNSVLESGAAYVFVRSGSTWSQQAYLKASNTGAGDFFGYAVAVSGDTIVAGAWQEDSPSNGVNGDQSDGDEEHYAEDSGAVYVFVRNESTWSQQAYLKASNTDFADNFGYSVAISGDAVVVGALQESSSATGVDGDQIDNSSFNSGAAYVFVRNVNTWSQQAYLKASNTQSDDHFGQTVAISGNAIVVGALDEDSSATGVEGNQGDNSAADAGAAYLFIKHGTVWSQRSYLKASNAEARDHFGQVVALCRGTLVVGTGFEASDANGVNGDQNDNSAGGSGAAYVFKFPLEDFTNAMTDAGLTGADALFDADPDKDGLANGLEWILGGNPTLSSLSVAPAISVDTSNATLTFTRLDISEYSATLKVQWSTNLGTWTDVPVTSSSSAGVTITEAGTAPDTVVVNVPRSNAASGKLFLRLVATYTAGD